MLDFTSHNFHSSNAALMNIYSTVDCGNAAIDDGVNLCLPSGTALHCVNRDCDVRPTGATA